MIPVTIMNSQKESFLSPNYYSASSPSDEDLRELHDYFSSTSTTHRRRPLLHLRYLVTRSRLFLAGLVAFVLVCFVAGYVTGKNAALSSAVGATSSSSSSSSSTSSSSSSSKVSYNSMSPLLFGSGTTTSSSASTASSTSWASSSSSTSSSQQSTHGHEVVEKPTWKKPEGFKIIGMVFYGRPAYVSILDCYLQRNLVKNGGFLDEIHFMAHTTNTADLSWLDTLVSSVDEYSMIHVNSTSKTYLDLWRHATDNETMYIKIDDDIIWVDDDAIPRLVTSLMKHPEAYLMASNLINSPMIQWVHFSQGAVHPWLPENSTEKSSSSLSSTPEAAENDNGLYPWRSSLLPRYTDEVPEGEFDFEAKSPYEGHRWLPLERTEGNLQKTPIANMTGGDWVFAVHSWHMAAQVHYSFLENLENEERLKKEREMDLETHINGGGSSWELGQKSHEGLGKYFVGGREGIFNMHYKHYNINFMAIWGKTLLELPFFDWWMDDEWAMSEIVPSQLKKPLLVDGQALVSHFAFHTQTEGLVTTDLLPRYRGFAVENVCEKGRGVVQRDGGT